MRSQRTAFIPRHMIHAAFDRLTVLTSDQKEKKYRRFLFFFPSFYQRGNEFGATHAAKTSWLFSEWTDGSTTTHGRPTTATQAAFPSQIVICRSCSIEQCEDRQQCFWSNLVQWDLSGELNILRPIMSFRWSFDWSHDPSMSQCFRRKKFLFLFSVIFEKFDKVRLVFSDTLRYRWIMEMQLLVIYDITKGQQEIFKELDF